MQRHVDINEISDGKKYKSSDMAKIGCNECSGCSKCCENMDGLITLDPYDAYRLTLGNINSFSELLGKNIDFTVDRGVTIPVLKMDSNTNKCTFLNDNGRCSIHNTRPGVCRLFPLGRLYEDGTFSYFLQKDECDFPNKTKVKIKNWLETEELTKYENYISDWHYFIVDIQSYMKDSSEDEIKQINTVLLQMFFITPYKDFYKEFYERLSKVKSLM